MNNDPFVKEYKQLTGKTVKRVVTSDMSGGDSDAVYGLEFTDGTVAWILCDPEGNGPGFLSIEKA